MPKPMGGLKKVGFAPKCQSAATGDAGPPTISHGWNQDRRLA